MPPKYPLPIKPNKKEKPFSYFLDLVDEYFYRHTHKAMNSPHTREQLARFMHSHQSTDVEVAILYWDNHKN